MYGQPPRNGGAGGPPPPYINPNYLHNSNFHLLNPNLHPSMNPFLQNPVFPIHNPNFPIHNPNFHVQQQVSHPNFPQQNPNFHTKQKVSGSRKSSEGVERIERAVVKARGDLLASGESVSSWKVSQAALLALKADSWESLGFQMQQVPSLHRLMTREGKINSFIHCFVGVQTITSLSDLEKAICENEGVQRFEELELGPLIRHPLVTHYFCVSSDVTKVYRISTEEIISCLGEYLDTQKGKEIKADKLLDFIAKKRSITSKEKLTIRIQSLGLHIDHIQQGRQIEDTTLKKCLVGSRKTKKKRPLFSTQKKQLDENFSTISQRIKSFSSTHGDISRTHIRFGSSSSEDDDSDDYGSEGNENDYSSGSHSNISSRNVNSSERVSSCPYPSAAEEMTRLGMKDVGDSPSVPGGSPYIPGTSGPSKNKRKCDTNSAPRKLAKRDGGNKRDSVTSSKKKASSKNEVDLSLPDDSMRMFLTTWKEACRENTVDEVFYRMCNFYEPKRTKKMVSTFSTYPYIGLLNVAVNSIKYGMWDSMYDSFQALGQQHIENTIPEKPCNYISIEVEPSEKNIQVVSKSAFKQQIDVSVEDIIRKISTFFEDYHDHPGDLSPIGKKYTFLKELYKCENWLVEQFSVEKFESLGYGEFLIFIEKHLSLLPPAFQMCLATEDTSEKLSLEACMPRHLLDVLLAQASNGLLENEKLSSQKISDLLTRQFPAVCFKLVTGTEDFSEIAENRSDLICKGVLFSSALSVSLNENTSSDLHLMSKDAIEVLLRAPMLADLDLWSHWDIIFAPSLGPLIGWLLNELNTKDLLCLVTRSGNIIRIDHSATVDSFLGAFLQGSSFQTAVKLLSLFAVYGGEKNVPLPLLKCHAQKAFEVMRDNSIVKEENNAENYLRNKLNKHKKEVDKAVAVASIFFLDCLAYLPVEFRRVAADILLSGFRCIFKDAPSAILSECKQTHHRLMLHDLGLLLGIAEWINDFHAFSLPAATTSFEPDGKLNDMKHSTAPAEGEIIMSVKAEEHNEECGGAHTRTNVSEIHGVCFDDAPIQRLSEVDGDKDSSIVIESIRREEFGLDPNLSVMGINILQRQHARLGRALHCLSQELYSQDSHFLLELVQNADDNVYPSFVEPTLSFILKKGGIVVLNNEQGFSAENIRALCDVGNSTKKNPGAGYIGKKGIGFKSVFRVTDTPEIHSNGFHIKFDITEGQIGFVLPTIVPPCDIDSFNKLVSADTEPVDKSSWNTCIILPFKSKHTEALAMDNIISMFSDLHPSLLLFLHRLECIKFRNLLSDSLIVMRKQVVGDGIVNVSLGKEKMTWFVESRVLQADAIRDDVQTTEISVAFTLEESPHGNYIPKLHQQPVFAFLPLRTYGLKFILQGDFILPSSREEVDGNSPWNQWLLSEFPNLFVNAERSVCSLPCFRQNPGLGVSAFMSFVPLTGEVHGFFSSLPRMIISKLRMANCLLLEGNNNDWVPPCKALRNWTEQARSLLPDDLIREHLGLGLLNKDIVLTDSLARALGVEEYGPKVLLQIMYSLCRTENGLKSMGLGWLSSWLAALHAMSYNSSSQSTVDVGNQVDIINNLKKIPFIPLLDGSYGSIDEGTIWLHTDALEGFDFEHGLEAFEKLYANLRIVSPALFNDSVIENLTPMLYKIGVKKLSPHEVLKMHILPAISDEKHTAGSNDLMTEYLSFIMSHLQSTCPSCYAEREFIISEVRNKALISTNHGYKRLVEVPIHFSKDYGNPIDINKIISGIDVRWHEVDCTYLKHPVIKSSSGGMLKWRKFLQELGVTDFTLVVQVEKSLADVSHSVLKNMMRENERLSPGSTVKDWESHELVHLVSQVSSSGDPKRCKYLLEVLDTLWDDYFSDKVTGYCNINGKSKPFRSSVISILHDMQWLASNMDNELHHPKDLFHDCDAVHSVLGETAPYAVPKIQSQKLLKDIGFKSTVTLDDTLAVLQVWRGSRTPFRASISQMSKFYTFIWNEASSTEQKILENLRSGAFIFVPYLYHSTHEVVPGSFLSAQEVYWNDSTGSLEQMKLLYPQYDRNMTHRPFNKMLCNIYPALYDFFVKECGVTENPPLLGYLQILLQLSAGTLPTQAAKTVFQVFLKWGDGLNSGLLSPEDVEHLKKSLEEKETMVLPTALDKWVSLHPSFGLICWSDDDELKKEFKNLNNIDFLYLGELNDEEKVMVRAKVSPLFRRLGITMLSEVVTREAVYYGLADSSFKASLLSWALPFAQRYIYSVHPNEYTRLKLSGFEILNRLQIVVVEKLFYINVIKRPDVASNKRFECSCLLQGSILYTTRESDSHSIFMEVSRFLLPGVPELPLANFLHMITTMAESGSTESQTEFFILNCQKIPNLPDGETIWSLQVLPSPATNEENLTTSSAFTNIIEPNPTKSKKKSGADSNWPPVNWKNAPGFDFAYKTQPFSSPQVKITDMAEEYSAQSDTRFSDDINADWKIEENPASRVPVVVLQDSEDLADGSDIASNMVNSDTNIVCSANLGQPGSSNINERDQLSVGTVNPQQALLTGRLGEIVAYKYFSGKAGDKSVKWVNEVNESGLPFDIIIEDKEKGKEYIEVKATRWGGKDWFEISVKEWQFAVEKGESFSIARVVLSGNKLAQVTTYRNPVKLSQLRQLQLAVVLPKQTKDSQVISLDPNSLSYTSGCM